MDERQPLQRDDHVVRTVETADGIQYVVDLGRDSDGTVDVVDETAIVVLDDWQYEIALLDGDAEAFIRNGVLTIDTEDSA
jgi:hypothetical protein